MSYERIAYYCTRMFINEPKIYESVTFCLLYITNRYSIHSFTFFTQKFVSGIFCF
jgi:hypothetical protein